LIEELALLLFYLFIFFFVRFDLLMLDCQMPFLSGPEVLARVRAAECNTGTARPVPAVMHSAGLLDESVIARLGGSAFIEKPFTRAKLLAALGQFFPDLPKH
jgi:CheY-like chemotaxis protein